MRSVAFVGAIVLLGLCFIGSWFIAGVRLKHIDGLQKETAKLNDQLAKLRGELHAVIAANDGGVTPESANWLLPGADDLEQRSATDVEARIQSLGDAATAQQLATCLSEIDSWLVSPSDEDKAILLKLQLASRLRQQVANEVSRTQRSCLGASTGAEAIKLHGEAGQLLMLYPMADDKAVIDEAKALSARQVDIVTRINVLRRQRYNQWAAKQIEAAIDGYNKGSSYWSPKKENKILMDSLAQHLSEVDADLLEPVVMELYIYIIDLTKGSISESEKVQLAKRLTDPSIQRKTLGDF